MRARDEYRTKLDYLKALWAEGRRVDALHEAAKFPRLGDHKEAIERGWAAASNPDLYRQMGHDPAELIDAGLAALAERYDLETEGGEA